MINFPERNIYLLRAHIERHTRTYKGGLLIFLKINKSKRNAQNNFNTVSSLGWMPDSASTRPKSVGVAQAQASSVAAGSLLNIPPGIWAGLGLGWCSLTHTHLFSLLLQSQGSRQFTEILSGTGNILGPAQKNNIFNILTMSLNNFYKYFCNLKKAMNNI